MGGSGMAYSLQEVACTVGLTWVAAVWLYVVAGMVGRLVSRRGRGRGLDRGPGPG